MNATADIRNSSRFVKPTVMGVLNVTPDSFSDGGCFDEPTAAVDQARRMIADGAEIIDIGAESTKPGSDRVSASQQLDRLRTILPAVCELVRKIPIPDQGSTRPVMSIDTTLAEVAAFALDAGAGMVNDISAGRDDPEILALVAERAVPIVLMHMLGQPCDMQKNPHYENVVGDVKKFLAERISAALAVGVQRENCIIDPGIGFGKTLEDNLALLDGVADLCELGCPVLIGPSRKRFIGELTAQPDPAARLGGTIAACLSAFQAGARIFRVHDVRAVHDALTVAAAIGGA